MNNKIEEYKYLLEIYRNEYASCKWWQFFKKTVALGSSKRVLRLLNQAEVEAYTRDLR